MLRREDVMVIQTLAKRVVNWDLVLSCAFPACASQCPTLAAMAKLKKNSDRGCQIVAIILPAEHGIAEQFASTSEFFEPTCPALKSVARAILSQSHQLGRWSGQFLGTFRSKSKLKRSFKPYDTTGQVFDVMLLLGDSGGELFNFVG